MTTSRKFELTAFEAPTKIRWTERSKNMITVPDGGYDLEKVSDTQTKVTIHNTFEGHGFGKLIVGFATRPRSRMRRRSRSGSNRLLKRPDLGRQSSGSLAGPEDVELN